MNKIYTIGDIHGELDKLANLIDKIAPDKHDQLIFLGDYVDRGPDSCGVITYLEQLSKKVYCQFILGNHDAVWYTDLFYNDAINTGNFTFDKDGSMETLASYEKAGIDPESHFNFFRNCQEYIILHDNLKRCFVHGGFNRHEFINEQHNKDIYFWDRDLLNSCMSYNVMSFDIKSKYKFRTKDNFDKIYLGHTPTKCWGKTEPMNIGNIIWLMDTGVGKYEDAELYALEIFSEQLIH